MFLPLSLSFYAFQKLENKVASEDHLPGGSMVKNLPANTGDTGDSVLIPGSGRSPGEGNSNPPRYSCLRNPMDRRTWQATVRGIAKNQTQLSHLAAAAFYLTLECS